LQEELFTGVTKKFTINRRIRDGPTGGYVQVSKMIECPIKPGYKAGTKLTFPDDGDEQPDGDTVPTGFCFCTHPWQKSAFNNVMALGSFQDIQFVIQEKPHSLFTRQSNDLHHKKCAKFTFGVL
jgi:DnaJ family protein B protein 4